MQKNKPLTIGLLFGGKSPEHEISLLSAKNIYAAMKQNGHQVVLLGVDYHGAWYEIQEVDFMEMKIVPTSGTGRLALLPGEGRSSLFRIADGSRMPRLDVIFPIIHGPNGEDGTLQGLLRQLDLPFVGPDVCGAAACRDKDINKRLLAQSDILVAHHLAFSDFEKDAIDYIGVINILGSPVFVKPANLGSSVGVHKVSSPEEFKYAIEDAFRFDNKILIEEAIIGRELECAVMGNDIPESTSVGEIIVSEGFYDYNAKYLDPDAAQVVIPAANLDEEMLSKCIMVAKSAYKVMGCEGLARVDLFLTEEGHVYINEINTLPGFTNISMYPKLWAHSGLSYPDLIDRLIELALDRHEKREKLQVLRLE